MWQGLQLNLQHMVPFGNCHDGRDKKTAFRHTLGRFVYDVSGCRFRSGCLVAHLAYGWHGLQALLTFGLQMRMLWGSWQVHSEMSIELLKASCSYSETCHLSTAWAAWLASCAILGKRLRVCPQRLHTMPESHNIELQPSHLLLCRGTLI